MKKILAYLLIFFACFGCHTARQATSIVTTKDSVTTILSRPVDLKIPADTASGEYKLTKFTQQLQEAPRGAVIASKVGKGKVASYKIVKSDSTELGFKVIALSAGKDTTVFVHDTITVVKEKTLKTQTLLEKPSLFQEIKTRVSWMFWGILLLIVVAIILRVTNR